MSDYRQQGMSQGDEPRQRIPEGFWPDYLLNMAIQWQGVNNRLPPEKLPNGFVPSALNCRMRNGDIEPRKGIVKPLWLNMINGTTVGPAGGTLYGAAVFSDPATREWTLIAADGYIWCCAPGNPRFALSVPPGVSVRQPVRMVQAFNQVYMFRGRYLRPLVLTTIDDGFEDVVAQYNSATGGALGSGVYQAAVQPIGQLADEMAYGPFIAVTSIGQSGTTVTVITGQVHGYATGADVVIQGATPAYFNGRWAVTVLDDYTFTFQTTAGRYYLLAPNTSAFTALNGGITSLQIKTPTPHGLTTGQQVLISGAPVASVNGTYTVTVIDATDFSITLTTAITADNVVYLNAAAVTLTMLYALPTGTITVSNMTNFWAALGDRLTLAAGALTSTGTTATVTYTAHGLSVGQWVTISGATPAGYNGIFQVQTVTANTFTFYVTSGLATPATAVSDIYVYKPTVTPGHTPDTNPEAWQQIYDILPNADDALYIDGRLLVPTAYTPGENGYDSTSSWTKADYIVAMDVFDGVHFQFTNGFRINQGDDSEITNLIKYDNNTVIVLKGKRWGILSNLQTGSYSDITFDLHSGDYGCTAVRAAVTAGKNVYFMSPMRGLTGLNQTQQGLVQSVDVPISNDVPQWLAQINWNAAASQRVAYWNDYIYWAVAINSSAVNNAVLVYDLRLGQWVSLDQGGGGTTLSVLEFFLTTINGLERLCYLDNSGWVNVYEEAVAGDQTGAGTWAEIPTDVTLKGHLFGQPGQKQFPLVELGIAVWNAAVTVSVSTGGARTVRPTTVTGKTWSRTQYLKPFNAAPWNPLNVNNDYSNPNRGDYSVVLQEGLNLTGCSTLQWQELFLRPSTKNFRASYALIRIQNATGRLKIKAVTPASQPGERRIGIMI